MDRELYVFAPPSYPLDRWHTQVLGRVIKPAVAQHQAAFAMPNWYWIGRYRFPWGAEAVRHGVPENQRWPGDESHQCFVKVRYRIDEATPFELTVQNLAVGAGCWFGAEPYDLVADLGKPRFLATEQNNAKPPITPILRAERVVRMLHAASELTLDSLFEDQPSHWRFEKSTDSENPSGSIFQSVAHLIGNMSDAAVSLQIEVQTLYGSTQRGAFTIPL